METQTDLKTLYKSFCNSIVEVKSVSGSLSHNLGQTAPILKAEWNITGELVLHITKDPS